MTAPLHLLGDEPVTDVLFFLKSAPVGRDLPWSRPVRMVALDPGEFRGTGQDPLTSTAYRRLFDSLPKDQVVPALLKRAGVRNPGRVAFVGFSAAHGFLDPLLRSAADRARVDAVYLMDACFGGGKAGYQAALRDAAEGRMLLVAATGPSMTTPYVGGTLCLEREVLEPTGLSAAPTDSPDPAPSGGAFRVGRDGVWLRYEDVPHVEFGRLTRPLLSAYLLPRWRGRATSAPAEGGFPWVPAAVAALGAAALWWFLRR